MKKHVHTALFLALCTGTVGAQTLTDANSIAICAPNRVSLGLVGRNRAYDSLNY